MQAEWVAGNFRDCNGQSNGTPLAADAVAAEQAAAANGDTRGLALLGASAGTGIAAGGAGSGAGSGGAGGAGVGAGGAGFGAGGPGFGAGGAGFGAGGAGYGAGAAGVGGAGAAGFGGAGGSAGIPIYSAQGARGPAVGYFYG